MATTKQQQLYDSLRERITSGIYGPGFRVVIDQLATEFGVSALPVREAIRRLEAEGLVIYRPNAGAQVAPAEPEAFGDNMTVLAVLEGYATALAAPFLSASDLKGLLHKTQEMAGAMEEMDSVSFGRHNREFHHIFHDRCPNHALISRLRDVERRLDAIRNTVFAQIPYRGASSIREHEQLIALVEGGAGADEIEHAARGHKLRTVESFRAWQQRMDQAT